MSKCTECEGNGKIPGEIGFCADCMGTGQVLPEQPNQLNTDGRTSVLEFQVQQSQTLIGELFQRLNRLEEVMDTVIFEPVVPPPLPGEEDRGGEPRPGGGSRATLTLPPHDEIKGETNE